jgi:hypothetical protein
MAAVLVCMNKWRARIAELNPEALSLDGFDDCIIGIVYRCSFQAVLLYDEDKCIQQLIKSFDADAAREYFEFNIAGAYMGEGTPMFAIMSVDED